MKIHQKINDEALETVLDLINQNSLYRGAEKKNLVVTFTKIKKDFDNWVQKGYDPEFFIWQEIAGINKWATLIKNDVIGTLLVDLSEGVELEKAVKTHKIAPLFGFGEKSSR